MLSLLSNRDYKSYHESKELKGNSGLVMSESVAEQARMTHKQQNTMRLTCEIMTPKRFEVPKVYSDRETTLKN